MTRSAKRSPLNNVSGVGKKRTVTLCSVLRVSANPSAVSANC